MKEREEKKQQRDPAAFFTDMMSWGANIRQPLAAHLWYIFNYLQLLLAYPLLRPLYPDRTEKTVGGGHRRFRSDVSAECRGCKCSRSLSSVPSLSDCLHFCESDPDGSRGHRTSKSLAGAALTLYALYKRRDAADDRL